MSSWFPNRLDAFVGNFVQRFAELLATEFQVSVIHTLGDKKINKLEVQDETLNGVRIVRAYHPVSINSLQHWWNQRKALRMCLSKIEDVDLIFAHVLLPRAYQFIKAKKYFHRDLVVLEHASYYRLDFSHRFNQFSRTFLRRSSRQIEQLCAVSNVLATDMKSVFPTTKITILPNFVGTDMFYPAEDAGTSRKRFLHVSTLDNLTKNPQLLFEGFKRAYENNKNISLTVISDQSTEKWQEWAKENNMESAIEWIGPSNWEEIAVQMRKHDCVLVTSTYETFNIVIAEAWCSGLPVISTNVGIAYEMSSDLGISLKDSDPQTLSEAIQQYTSGALQFNPKVIRKEGLKYSKEQVLEQMKTIFEPHFQVYE